MAKWIRNRPEEFCDLEELKVAEYLSELSDDWVIRWGFFYRDNRRNNREGDFLILGPHGGLMVVEVKGGTLDPYWGTGKWGTADGDHPLIQLDAEWKAVLTEIKDHQKDRPSLFVSKAIALPGTNIAPQLDRFHDIPRDLILSKDDLRHFTKAWDERFSDPKIRLDGRAREIFFDAYGEGITPKAIRRFVNQTDRMLMRQTECSYELLDQLAGNRQLLVQGGMGTGKTWLAFEQARRWAEESEEGNRVLFLSYNLALTALIRDLAATAKKRKRPAKGEIVVQSWEELAKGIFEKAGLPFEVPDDRDEVFKFYSEVVPELMVEAVRSGVVEAEFDALVVDEGQDHDTGLENAPEGFEGPGWWGIYWRLLREGSGSPIAVFCDPPQRPDYRGGSSFDIDVLRDGLTGRPVDVHLTRTVRYTGPVYRYLKSLECPATQSFVGGMVVRQILPEGPEVEILQSMAADTADQVTEVVKRWIEDGHCRVNEILIISSHGDRSKSALGEVSELAGFSLVDYLDRRPGTISYTSAQKAKGLDALAVILIDFMAFKEIEKPGFQESFFMGASRARQLLAVIELID